MTKEEELEILRRKLVAAKRYRGHEERARMIEARIAELADGDD